jgi:hypothetical protein
MRTTKTVLIQEAAKLATCEVTEALHWLLESRKRSVGIKSLQFATDQVESRLKSVAITLATAAKLPDSEEQLITERKSRERFEYTLMNALGLPDSATAADILPAIEALKAKPKDDDFIRVGHLKNANPHGLDIGPGCELRVITSASIVVNAMQFRPVYVKKGE